MVDVRRGTFVQAESEIFNSDLMSKMGGAAQVSCKFHKTGHCKFGQNCRHFHSQTICSVANCDKKCLDRHPKPCRSYARLSRCKFGSNCSYLHCDSDPANDTLIDDVKELKEALKQVMQNLKAKEDQIQMLEEKMLTVIANANISFASDTSLPSPEKMRSEVCEDSLQVSLMDEEREESSPVPSASPSARRFNSSDQCQYWLCEFKSTSEKVMNQHIVDAHTIDSNFTYPSSNEKTICGYDIGPQDQFPDCEECDEEFYLDQAFAMHLYNSHKVGYDCVHCSKYLPGDDELYSVHLQLCTAPCDGHPRCPCRY